MIISQILKKRLMDLSHKRCQAHGDDSRTKLKGTWVGILVQARIIFMLMRQACNA